MATLPTIKELRAMQPKDLQNELTEQQNALSKIRLSVELGGEKDTAKLRRLRKQVARMHTVANQKKNATMPAPKHS